MAGPIAAAVGVSATQYGAAALILVVSALALIPRDVRQMRADHALPPATAAVGEHAGVAAAEGRGDSGRGGGTLAGLPGRSADAEAIPAEAAVAVSSATYSR